MQLATTLQSLEAETTLFIVSSKSFSTQETLANARTASAWLEARLGKGNAAAHVVAITANARAAREFGVAEDAILDIWEWVGGRYSLWSAVGLPILLATGNAAFEALLAGAHEMDVHFRHTPVERNIPVLAGLIDVWNVNFFGARATAILPYDQRLKRLPEYLQQLVMKATVSV
jgi:glucose-6-phosphate isomerase